MDQALAIPQGRFLKRKDSVLVGPDLCDSQSSFEEIKSVLASPPEHRTEKQIYSVVSFTRNLKFFSDLRDTVGELAHFQCCRHLTYTLYQGGKAVFNEGDLGSQFFIILSGSCSVVSFNPVSEKFKLLAILRGGESFGELSLISKNPRAATVLCRETCHFAVLEREDYTRILENAQQKQLEKKAELLQKLPVFSEWRSSDIRRLSYFFRERHVKKNQALFLAGQNAKEVFLIQDGTFKLTNEIASLSQQYKPPRKEADLTTVTAGELLGVLRVLRNAPYDYSCTCLSPIGSALVISKKNFKRMVCSGKSLTALTELDAVKEAFRAKRLLAAIKVEEMKGNLGNTPTNGTKSMVLKQKPNCTTLLEKFGSAGVDYHQTRKLAKSLANLRRRYPSVPVDTPDSFETDKKHQQQPTENDLSKLEASAPVDLSLEKRAKKWLLPKIQSSGIVYRWKSKGKRTWLARNSVVSVSMYQESTE